MTDLTSRQPDLATADSDATPPQGRRAGARGVGWLATIGYQLLLLAVALTAWELLVEHGLLTTLTVSRPSDVWRELSTLSSTGELVGHVSVTLQETVLGYVLGVVVGAALGFAVAFLPRVRAVIDPYVTMLNSLPRFALGPLYILWFGVGIGSKVALVFSLVVFVLFVNTEQGVRAVDQELVAITRLLGGGRRQVLTKVIVPATFPWIVAGMRLSIAYAVAGAVVGEMFASQQGVGYLITAGSGVFNTAQIFAGLVMIMIIAWGLDILARKVERRVLHWRPEVELS